MYASKNIYRDRSEDSAPLGDIFFYLRNLTLPAHDPAPRFSCDMVGTRGSLVGPEANATERHFTRSTVQTVRTGKTTTHEWKWPN